MKRELPFMLAGMLAANAERKKKMLNVSKTEPKIVSPELKKSRKLRKLEKKQQNQMKQEALKKGHESRIEKMKMKRFKNHNKLEH